MRTLLMAFGITMLSGMFGCATFIDSTGLGALPEEESIVPDFVPEQGQIVTLPEQNPMLVQVSDREFAWTQIVDTVDDYFIIHREHRVRQLGDVLTPGRIDTLWQVGATMLEPHRRDAANRYQRWHNTLQSIRRQATVIVTPESDGYLIEVLVTKEQEDPPDSILETTGSATFRHDDSVDRRDSVEYLRNKRRGPSGGLTSGSIWIPLGRDRALEQQILSAIRMHLVLRSSDVYGGQPPFLVPLPAP